MGVPDRDASHQHKTLTGEPAGAQERQYIAEQRGER